MSTTSKRILVVFDLNCLLGYMTQSRKVLKENTIYKSYAPTKIVDSYHIWTRPHLDILFKSMYIERKDSFETAVWACQSKENAEFQINQYFGSLKYNLRFALFTKPKDDSLLPHSFKKDLKIIYDKHSSYDELNTIIVSNCPNDIVEYRDNEIILPIYHPELGTTQFNSDAHLYYLFEYLALVNSLRIQNKTPDVREVMKQVPYIKYIKLRSGSTTPDRTKWDVSGYVRF